MPTLTFNYPYFYFHKYLNIQNGKIFLEMLRYYGFNLLYSGITVDIKIGYKQHCEKLIFRNLFSFKKRKRGRPIRSWIIVSGKL